MVKPRYFVKGTRRGREPPHWNDRLMDLSVPVTDEESGPWRRENFPTPVHGRCEHARDRRAADIQTAPAKSRPSYFPRHRSCADREEKCVTRGSDRAGTRKRRSGSACLGYTRARERQDRAAFARLYARRAGIEATHSLAVRRYGLRRARYAGSAKVRLQHVATAAALNLSRIVRWIAGEPVATTRSSHFSRLLAPAAAA